MTFATVQAAIENDRNARETLVRLLSPVIQMRVRRALARRPQRLAAEKSVHDEDDLIQEVFLALFDKDAKALRAWDRERGASLTTFVGVVAEHRVSSLLRRDRRRPLLDQRADAAIEMTAVSETPPEVRVASRELASRLVGRLRGELSVRGFEIFHALFIDEDSVDAVCERKGMTAVAVWAWRSRLKKRVRELAEDLDRSAGPKRLWPNKRDDPTAGGQ